MALCVAGEGGSASSQQESSARLSSPKRTSVLVGSGGAAEGLSVRRVCIHHSLDQPPGTACRFCAPSAVAIGFEEADDHPLTHHRSSDFDADETKSEYVPHPSASTTPWSADLPLSFVFARCCIAIA